MTVLSTVSPCRAPGCRGQGGDPQLTPGVFCPACIGRIRHALADLPRLYVQLHQALEPASATGEKITMTRTPPLPLRGDVLSLMDDVTSLLLGIEDTLRTALAYSPRPTRGRHGPTIDGATRWITAQFELMLTSPDVGEYGAGILQLHNTLRRTLGATALVHRLPAPCPNLDCALMTLVRYDGDDHVTCQACRNVWPEADYQRLVLVLTSAVKLFDREEQA